MATNGNASTLDQLVSADVLALVCHCVNHEGVEGPCATPETLRYFSVHYIKSAIEDVLCAVRANGTHRWLSEAGVDTLRFALVVCESLEKTNEKGGR